MRSDDRPHQPRDRCVFGCCEKLEEVMPYIKKSERVALELSHSAHTPGELNYLITITCMDYLERKGKSYGAINDIVGVLECAKLEFYRRLVAPYENGKIVANGDVDQYAYHSQAR